MAEGEIPEDIWQIAEGIADDVHAGWSWDGMATMAQAAKSQEELAKAIAEALLSERRAERERCAEVAEKMFQRGMPIAAAIRQL